MEAFKQVAFPGCSEGFEPALYQYGKLREKIAIEIIVKAVRVAHIVVVEE